MRPHRFPRVAAGAAPRAARRAALFLASAAAIASLAAAPARAERLFLPREREGPWLGSDKTLHAAASAALAASFRVRGDAETRAFALTFGIGIGKELYDATLKPRASGRGASRKDLVADLLGAAAGVLLIRALER